MATTAAVYESNPIPSTASRERDTPRIRLLALRAHRSPAGLCRAEVELERLDGTPVVGSRDGRAIAIGDLRIVAEATIDAIHRATTTDHRFELLGVKTVRAFDENVVLVQLSLVRGAGPARLVGAALGVPDCTRAAVLAVLNATNRVLAVPPA